MKGLPDNMPRPVPTPHSAPFWEACREGRLVVQQCEDCGAWRHPPGPLCAGCGSGKSRWVDSKGSGEIFTYIIVQHPVDPALRDYLPYNVVVVRLDDCGQVLITSNVMNVAPENVRVGMRLKFAPDDVGDGVVLPRFVAID